MTWRGRCAETIFDIIQREGTADMKHLKKVLREAYPFGERKWHPYKVWCDEIRRQLGLKTSKPIVDVSTKSMFEETQ